MLKDDLGIFSTQMKTYKIYLDYDKGGFIQTEILGNLFLKSQIKKMLAID
jgi:hypothetical protein